MDGQILPQHACEDRSELARLFAVVFTQPEGAPPVWHHQILIGDSQPIAIRFCPFCGVRLDRAAHFP